MRPGQWRRAGLCTGLCMGREAGMEGRQTARPPGRAVTWVGVHGLA
jgi:hypothetical protein